MRTTGIILALMLSSSTVLADAPVKKAETEEDLKALLRRLVPEDAEGDEKSTKEKPVAAKKAEDVNKEADAPIAAPIKSTPSSQKIAGNAIPFAFGLLVALAFFTLSNRRKQSGDRAIRRIAIEPLGSKQSLMLVEALGEYLLVATGGREPVLLAQLDTEQAKQRLEQLNVAKPQEPSPKTSWLNTAKQSLKKLTPNRTPNFDDILDEAPINIESTATKKTKKQSAAKLALAQASFKAIANEDAPQKKSLNERLAEIAAEESPATQETKKDRADAIRRRLASL